MDRRHFMTTTFGTAALLAGLARGGEAGTGPALPNRREIRVAFLLGDHANVIDTAGAWEVFQDTHVDGRHPFRLYTVAPTRRGVRMTGGLVVEPTYTIDDAPSPHLIVVPAQRANDAARRWLARASANADLTMSVCTGAFQLARVGLLDGLAATTHHDFHDAFAKEFPQVELRRAPRFVDNGRIATAGGLTSGIDLALHVVRRYFGVEVAAATARYMEYDSDAWRTRA